MTLDPDRASVENLSDLHTTTGTMGNMSDDPHTAADLEFGGCGDPACPTGDHDGSVVDLDATDVRLADGTRLTNEVAEQLVDEIRASAAKLHDPKV